MKLLKTITFANIIIGIIYFAVGLNITPFFPAIAHVMAVGYLLTIGYNWTVIRMLTGQKIKWIIPYVISGVLIVLFGFFLIADSIYIWSSAEALLDQTGGLIFIGSVKFIFGASITYQAFVTVRFDGRLEHLI